MFALQRASLKSGPLVLVHRLELLGSAGYPDSGRLPTRVTVKASSFKERVWGWRRTNKHMEKY